MMESGEDLRSFALRCARAFGACVMMRDDDLDAPIPERFEPSDYSVKRLAEAEAALTRLAKMSRKQQVAFGNKEKKRMVADRRKWAAEHREANARLNTMEREVERWLAPTPEHQGLRDFMLEQLRISKDDETYWDGLVAAEEAKPPLQFYTDALAQAASAIDYHRKEMVKEQERADQRTRWIQQLRASLPPPHSV